MTPTNPTADLLIAAKALIDAPEKLARGVWARDAKGMPVPPHSPDAVCWCSGGAFRRAAWGNHPRITVEQTALRIIVDAALPHSFVTFSDTAPWPEVMAMWDRAIGAAVAA